MNCSYAFNTYFSVFNCVCSGGKLQNIVLHLHELRKISMKCNVLQNYNITYIFITGEVNLSMIIIVKRTHTSFFDINMFVFLGYYIYVASRSVNLSRWSFYILNRASSEIDNATKVYNVMVVMVNCRLAWYSITCFSKISIETIKIKTSFLWIHTRCLRATCSGACKTHG